MESQSLNTRVNVSSNLLEDSFAKGSDVALFYVEGAALTATSNIVKRCGHLDSNRYNFTTLYDEDYKTP